MSIRRERLDMLKLLKPLCQPVDETLQAQAPNLWRCCVKLELDEAGRQRVHELTLKLMCSQDDLNGFVHQANALLSARLFGSLGTSFCAELFQKLGATYVQELFLFLGQLGERSQAL
ncbi:unnamed protein product [Symbiodinium natans]|uniref:Uncharacterized protein n=1 Tax=Symbiodinium natans TaxID=878477 RepID=A0A812N6P3_9DINO|nr:unnamed protein product [Symbiodinium natans]